MARKVGQIIHRGDRRWLVSVYLERDPGTCRRRYRNQTVRGTLRDAQHFLNCQLQEHTRTLAVRRIPFFVKR